MSGAVKAIGELSRLSGISVRRIRFYSAKGLLRRYREFDLTWRERRVAMLATVPGLIQPRTSSEAIPVRYTRLSVHGDGHHEVLIPASSSAASSLERCLDR